MPFRKRPGPTRPALPFTPPVGPYADCRHRQQRIAAERAASTDKRPGKNAPDIRRGNRVKRALQDRLSGRGSWSGCRKKTAGGRHTVTMRITQSPVGSPRPHRQHTPLPQHATARSLHNTPPSPHVRAAAAQKNGHTLAGCARQLFRRLGFHCQVSTVSGEQAELAPGQRMRSAARTINSSWKIARAAR